MGVCRSRLLYESGQAKNGEVHDQSVEVLAVRVAAARSWSTPRQQRNNRNNTATCSNRKFETSAPKQSAKGSLLKCNTLSYSTNRQTMHSLHNAVIKTGEMISEKGEKRRRKEERKQKEDVYENQSFTK